MKLRAYRIYVTDCAQLCCNNIANALGGQTVTTRFLDLIEPHEVEEADADEIKDRIINGLKELKEDE